MSSGALFKKGKRGPRGQNSHFWLYKFWNICARSGPPQLGVVLVIIIITVEPVWATTLPFHEKVVAVDRWSPLAVKIYSKNDLGAAKKSGREGRWSPLAGGRLYRVHCMYHHLLSISYLLSHYF